MKNLLSLLVLLASATAFGDDIINLGFGPAIDGASLQPHVLSVRYEKDFGASFALVGNASGFFEERFLGAVSVIPSVKVVTPNGTFLRMGVGIGAVTHTDARLSSIPEFNIEAAWGLTNGKVDGGLIFDHWSNGTVLGPGPNLGWDVAQFAIGYHL